MNTKRLAQLFRERAALDQEIAEAFEQTEPKRARKRSVVEPTVQPSESAIEKTRRNLRKRGVAA